MATAKKRLIKSLDTLSEDLRDLMRDQYPNGYEASITRITNAKREPIFVFPLETDDAVYLVKVPATKNSDGGYDVDSGGKQEFESDDDDFRSNTADDFDNNSDSDNDSDGYDDDGDGGGRRGGKEASYDPDFDG